MTHLICTVGPRRFIIETLDGEVVLDQTVELEKFVDAQKEVKYMNPTHSIAWDSFQRVYRETHGS